MNKIIKNTTCLALLGLASLSSCNNSPFSYGEELIPTEKIVEGEGLAYLSNGLYPNAYASMGYKEGNGAFFDEWGGAEFYVMLSKPANEDTTLELALSSDEGLKKRYNEQNNKEYQDLPLGVLALSKNSVTIKKGEIKSEPISLSYADRAIITSDDADFITTVKISKSSNDKAKPSKTHNAFVVTILRDVVKTMPITEANLEGLIQIDNSDITATSSNHLRRDEATHASSDMAAMAFDGSNSPYEKFQTTTHDLNVRWYDNIYLTAKLKEPITFAAYQMELLTSSIAQQVSSLGLEVSTDGGLSWKKVGVQTFDMGYKIQQNVLVWNNPAPIVRLYQPIEGVNAIRWNILDMQGGRSGGTASIAEMKLFKK